MKALSLILTTGFSLSALAQTPAPSPSPVVARSFSVPAHAPEEDCARRAVDAFLAASPYPQIQVVDLHKGHLETLVFRPSEKRSRFDFTARDPEDHAFNGWIILDFDTGFVEEPLSGERTYFLECDLVPAIFSDSFAVVNKNGTLILRR